VPDPFWQRISLVWCGQQCAPARLPRSIRLDYEFASSTDYYCSGRFDETLLKMLAAYDNVMDIILPTLGPERRATYSPFLPISPRTGHRTAGADDRAQCRQGHRGLYRSRHRREGSKPRSPAAT
jgi:lysyl-tRNA synthetase class I